MNDSDPNKIRAKRAPKRYWREISGKLYARLQYQDESGKWKEKLKPITDKRTAQRVVEEMRRELEQHGAETLESDKMTFSDLAERYERAKFIPARYSNGVKVAGKRSLAPSQSAIKPLKEHFGRRHLRAVKASDLEAYKQKRLDAPVEIERNVKIKIENPPVGNRKKFRYEKAVETHPRKVASVNRELELLRAMFNYAIENDWLIKNPFAKKKGVISKAAEVERDRTLTFQEEAKLLAFCVDQRAHLKAILICALDTGMRSGEMFKMRWREVHTKVGEIYIPKENTKIDAERTVGMTPRLKAELEKLWKVSPQNESELVFGITSTTKTAWRTLRRNVGIKGFRMHDCRRTATTRMIASGSPHLEVMKITGHTQLKTFLRYLNITPETAKKVAGRLNDYLDQSVPPPTGADSLNQ